MLASDMNNPAFVGAINPDDALYVKFEMHTPEDPNKSAALNRKVYQTIYKEEVGPDGKKYWKDTGELRRVPYVTIMKPGDPTSIVHTEVRDDHKRRWPRQWLAFQIEEGLIDDGAMLPGWKVDDWEEVNKDPEVIRNLKHMRFYTVEQVAGASDAQVQRMGLGGNGLREAAKQSLRAKMGMDVRAEIAAKDAKMAEMQRQLEELSALVKNAAPQVSVTARPEPTSGLSPVVAAPKKRGRPKKVKDGEQHPT